MKRFYQSATVEKQDGHYRILLDRKAVKTPAKETLILPNEKLAQAVAAEWEAQPEEGDLEMQQLPLTGFASLAIDVAEKQRAALVTELLEYAETDLLFYHEDKELSLQQQQQTQWQPWVEWAQKEFSTRYKIVEGINPIAQPADNAQKHQQFLDSLDSWQLACFAAMAKPTTSFLLSAAFLLKQMDAEALFLLSRLEESFNATKWGEDADNKAKAMFEHQEMIHAQTWRDLL